MNSHKQGEKQGNSRWLAVMVGSVVLMGVMESCRAADTWPTVEVVECASTDYECRIAEVQKRIDRLDAYLANDDNFRLTRKQPKNALSGKGDK